MNTEQVRERFMPKAFLWLLRLRAPGPGRRPSGSAPGTSGGPSPLLRYPRTPHSSLQALTCPPPSPSSVSVSSTSPPKAGAGVLPAPLLAPAPWVQESGTEPACKFAKSCTTGRQGGHWRVSASPQRPLLGASRGLGHSPERGHSPRRGCTHTGRRSRRRP